MVRFHWLLIINAPLSAPAPHGHPHHTTGPCFSAAAAGQPALGHGVCPPGMWGFSCQADPSVLGPCSQLRVTRSLLTPRGDEGDKTASTVSLGWRGPGQGPGTTSDVLTSMTVDGVWQGRRG